MSALLERLMGRIPVGWLQLTHNKGRLAAALAGVAFANVLVFVQLGIMGSLNATIIQAYELFDADIMISAADATTLSEGGNVARQWMFQALADRDVAAGATLFVGNVTWSRKTGDTTLQTFGMEPDRVSFLTPSVARKASALSLSDRAIIDHLTRGLSPEIAAAIGPRSPLRFEAAGRTLTVGDTFEGGVGFEADGYMIVSDQTFLRLFPGRGTGAPDHILLKVAPTASVADVVDRLKSVLPADLLRIRSLADAAAADQRYQTTERPTGLIFGFGVAIGVLVGIVIVYQVLSTDVVDHISEYATFKAMGYSPSFFLGVIFEEAIILALLGFGPGIVISLGLYELLNGLTGLPIAMAPATAIAVFLGTLAACSISGAVATRRLATVDPADLF